MEGKVGKFIVWACCDHKRGIIKDINEWYDKFGTTLVERNSLNSLLNRCVSTKEEYDKWLIEVELVEDNLWTVINDEHKDHPFELEELAFLVNILRRECEQMIELFYELDPLEEYIDQNIDVFLGHSTESEGLGD